MAQTCIHGVPEQELTSKKLSAPSHSCPTGKAASLLFFLLSSCCFGRVAAVNFSALTQESGQQMDDDQHQSDWPHKNRLYNLLRTNGNDRHDHRFAGTGLPDHRRSLRQFRHNNPTRSYYGREHEGSAAAAAKGEAYGDRRPTAHAAVADSGQRGDDIFVHSNDEQSFQAQTPRYPTGTGTGWEEQQREEEMGASELSESPELDLNKNGEENSNQDRPSLSTSTLTHMQEQDQQRDEQEEEQMKIRQHLELSTCLSTLNSFAALTQDAPVAGQSARQPTAMARPKHLITKQGILDLLSDAVSTASASASASADMRSSKISIAEMRWTDLPLPLIMQYNYASCSGPSYERKDGICTAAGEGVALETIGGGGPLQDEASTFNATRPKWPRRRYNNGGKEGQERIGFRGEGKSGRSVEWPLRMLCREVTNYAQELAEAASIFAGPGDDTSQMSSNHLDVELHYSFVMSNVSYALFHSARSSRTGSFGSANGLVGRIRQRAMLKQKLAIATESVIRMFLGCSVSKSMEEDDLIPLLEDNEVLRTTLMHRAHRVKVNVKNAGKAEGYNKRRSRRGLELGANPGYRATRSSIYEASSTHAKETKGDAITRNVSGHRGEASSGGTKPLENEQQHEIMGANDLESAVFGGCDFIISANVEKLQKISCQDKYSYGCALVESSVYVKVNQGSGVGNWTFSDDASAIRIDLLRAIEESVQNGLFRQLLGIK